MDFEQLLAIDEARLISWDDRYAVTRGGDVWSRANGGHLAKNPHWKKLKFTHGNGDKRYLAVSLGAGKRRLAHRLVAEAFIGKCPEGQDVRHLDGVHHNNAATNLAYGTRTQNMADAKRHGTTCRGERNGNSFLTVDKVREIRQTYEQGFTHRQVSAQFSISYEQARQIRLGLRWGWLDNYKAKNRGRDLRRGQPRTANSSA